MRGLLLVPWLWVAACVGSVAPETDKTDTDETDTDNTQTPPAPSTTSSPSTSTTPTSTTQTTFDCFSQYEEDLDMDGVIDTLAYQGYDPYKIDQMLYQELDFGADGTIDGWLRRTYDGAGDIVHREYANGMTDDSTYDDTHHMLTYVEDGDGDGVTDHSQRWDYDAAGGLLHAEIDRGADGSLDYTLDYTNDAAGRPLSFGEDSEGDGIIDRLGVYTYDSYGRVVLLEETYAPQDPLYAYRVVSATIYTDALLLVGSTEVDYGDDGLVDSAYTFVSDAEGQLVSWKQDDQADGTIEVEAWYLYDADHHLLSNTGATYSDAGGTWAETFSYDGLGRQIEYAYEATGEYPYATRIVWTFGGTCPS